MALRGLVAVLALLHLMVPAAADHDEVGSGHIAAGGPWTDIRSITVLAEPLGTGTQGIDGFFAPAPAAGTALATLTMDGSGLGFDVNLNFHDADLRWLGGCASTSPDEGWGLYPCRVPQGAVTVEATARRGVDLDVTIVTRHA